MRLAVRREHPILGWTSTRQQCRNVEGLYGEEAITEGPSYKRITREDACDLIGSSLRKIVNGTLLYKEPKKLTQCEVFF
jgi:hypothetical protein